MNRVGDTIIHLPHTAITKAIRVQFITSLIWARAEDILKGITQELSTAVRDCDAIVD